MTDRLTETSKEVIEKGSKSFAAAARLFGPEIRTDVYQLYAWCRRCDDEIDGQELGFGSEALTARDRERRLERIIDLTGRALAGAAVDDPAFAGLQRVVTKHRIPQRYPLELIDGFAMDVRGRRYRSLDDTLSYCYHVAGVVGIMMACIMGVREASVLRRAADLGIAFQLTNIARDVIDDARNGRVYLPEQWLAAAGVPIAEVADERHRAAVFECVRRLLAEADRYYASARDGIGQLPFRCAWAIAAADRVYHNIGDIVIARGQRAWDERAVSPAYRKVYCVMRSGLTALRIVKLHRHRRMNRREPGLWSAKPDIS